MFAEAEFWDLFDDFSTKLNNQQFVKKYKQRPEELFTFYQNAIDDFSSRYSTFQFSCFSIKKQTKHSYYLQMKNRKTEFWIEFHIPQTGECYMFDEHFSGEEAQKEVVEQMKQEFYAWIKEQHEHRLSFVTGALSLSESEVG